MKTLTSVKSWNIKQSNPGNEHQNFYAATIRKTTADNEEIRISVYSQSFDHAGFTINIRLVC